MSVSDSVTRTRRRAAAFQIVRAANALDTLSVDNLDQALETDKDFFSEAELAAIGKVREALATCEGNLRKIAKRMGVES